MRELWRSLPWPITTAAVVASAAALAIIANLLIGPYFERSELHELDPREAAAAGADNRTPDPSPTAAPASPAAAPTAALEPADGEGVVLQGEWRDGAPGHNGEGIVKIIRTSDGKLFLRVEQFSVTNGPDLIVVLSPDDDEYADGSLNLGALKATDGNFNYEIPAGTDLTRYKSAVVWCQSFPTTFAYATLEAV